MYQLSAALLQQGEFLIQLYNITLFFSIGKPERALPAAIDRIETMK
ncbi:hypothetical protein [Geosporobacter ferrireducens]|nr:hypothetical protein [Geosporobacter ferrireducens]